MKSLASLFVLAATTLAILLATACSSGLSNEEACDKFKSLCNTSTAGDGGTGVTISVTCNPDSFDSIDNEDEVKDCLEGAGDCNAATACMLKGKK